VAKSISHVMIIVIDVFLFCFSKQQTLWRNENETNFEQISIYIHAYIEMTRLFLFFLSLSSIIG